MASVGCSMVGSARSSTRMSPGAWRTAPRMSFVPLVGGWDQQTPAREPEGVLDETGTGRDSQGIPRPSYGGPMDPKADIRESLDLLASWTAPDGLARRRARRRDPLTGELFRAARCARLETTRRAARARDRQATRAVLRSRVRTRVHPVHRPDDGRPDVDRARPGHARPRRHLVGMGLLRLADQPHRTRGRRRPPRHVRRDGRAPHRGPVHPSGLRRPRLSRSPSPTRSSGSATSPSTSSPPATGPGLQHWLIGYGGVTTVVIGLLVGASFAQGAAQARIWLLAIAVDGATGTVGRRALAARARSLRRAAQPRDHPRPRRDRHRHRHRR